MSGVGFKDLEELEKRLLEKFSDVVYKSHLSIKEVDSGLHQTLLNRLDKQDEILEKVVTQNDEMYKVLTTSKTLWDALKTIGKWVIGLSAFTAASMYLRHFLGEINTTK